MSPEPDLYNCQDAVGIDLAGLKERFRQAFKAVLESTTKNTIGEFEEFEASIVDDAEIARIHGEFMDEPTPTDVITFQHGELIVSAETAAREAEKRGWPLERELLLYLIHGLLHLQGFDDIDEDKRWRMHFAQDCLLEEVWPLNPAAAES